MNVIKNISINTWEKLFLIFLMLVLIFKGIVMIDPDFGWRLRTGFYILENSVPKTDLYTYTMPDFPWVDHAWLTDVLISGVYGMGNVYALGLLLGITIIATFYIIAHPDKAKNVKSLSVNWFTSLSGTRFLNPITLFTIAILLLFASVRVQVVTWLFLAILIKIIFDNKLWSRFRLLMPLFFLLWANLHGGFISGLVILWLVIGIRLIRRKSDLTDLLIATMSTLATFINLYGEGVYKEIWSSISDNRLRFEIIEWRPAFLTFDIPTISLFSLSVIFVFHYRNKFNAELLLVYLMLLFQGIMSIRHLPLWAIMATPITISAISYFHEDISKNKLSLGRFNGMYKYLFFFSLFAFGLNTWFSLMGAVYLSENKYYPREAVEFLKTNRPMGEIFSDYGWGGYLIWKLPEKKVFIDGRMPSWKSTGDTMGSRDAMKEYLGIMKGKEDYKPLFEKYSVNTLLWPVKKEKTRLEKFEEKMSEKFNFIYKALGFSDKKFYLPEKLEADGWKKIYEDKSSVILISN